MSWTSAIFVGSDKPEPVMATLEEALQQSFVHEEGTDPYLVVGTTAIYVGAHDFEDDDIGGRWVPLASEYPQFIEIRDPERSLERQQELASRIANVLKEVGRWRFVRVEDMEYIPDSYDPTQSAEQQAP